MKHYPGSVKILSWIIKTKCPKKDKGFLKLAQTYLNNALQ